MPVEVWGLRVGDLVEYRPNGLGGMKMPWEMGEVIRISTARNPIVRPQNVPPSNGGSLTVEVLSPKNIRKWEPPSTPDDIQKFLEG